MQRIHWQYGTVRIIDAVGNYEDEIIQKYIVGVVEFWIQFYIQLYLRKIIRFKSYKQIYEFRF